MSKALLIVDTQKRWISPTKTLFPEPRRVVSNLIKLREHFSSRSYPIFFITLEHRADGSTKAPYQPKPINVTGTEEAEIIDELTPLRDGEHKIVKRRYSAYHGTDLFDRLIQHGVSEVVVTGYQMRACVFATALDTYQHDFPTVLIEDAVLETDKTRRDVNLYIFREWGIAKTTGDWLKEQK